MTTSSPHVSHLPYINTITTGLLYNCFLKIYFDYAITVVPIFLLSPFTMYPPFPLEIPPLSLCPWVVHKSSLASPFPTLFLTSPCLFCTYQLCFLIPFPPFSLFPLPAANPLGDLHSCDSVLFWLFAWSVFLRCSC